MGPCSLSRKLSCSTQTPAAATTAIYTPMATGPFTFHAPQLSSSKLVECIRSNLPKLKSGPSCYFFDHELLSRNLTGNYRSLSMEKLLKKFNVPAKHGSEQELSLWRNHVMPVKNHRRRFRYVADLDKRLKTQEEKTKIREKVQASITRYMEALKSIDAGDDQDPDLLSERVRETEEILKADTGKKNF